MPPEIERKLRDIEVRRTEAKANFVLSLIGLMATGVGLMALLGWPGLIISFGVCMYVLALLPNPTL